MKNIDEVLLNKEIELARVQKELESLAITARLLEEQESQPAGSVLHHNTANRGVTDAVDFCFKPTSQGSPNGRSLPICTVATTSGRQ